MSCNEQEHQELEEIIQNAVEYAFDDLTAEIEDSVENAVRDAVQNLFSEFEFMLPDGTRVIPKKRMRLTNPDKTKVLLCYGGLRADGLCLSIQTGAGSWESIHVYPTKDEAVAALEKVKKAMDDGLDSFDL